MHLTKMEGLGNDYLYYYGTMADPASVSVRFSNRHFGIGSDGLILIEPSAAADFKMRLFNADGSEAKMCGNGIRCVGKYVYDKGYTTKKELTIETLSGLREIFLHTGADGKVDSVSVEMGEVVVSDAITLDLGARIGKVTMNPVSTGNPHAVVFVDRARPIPVRTWGPRIEKHPYFGDGVNVEFVRVIDENTLRMRVWERGSGLTMACGTGSCAVAAAAVLAGLCRAGERICVKLDGGDLHVTVRENGTVLMEGPAITICECEVE